MATRDSWQVLNAPPNVRRHARFCQWRCAALIAAGSAFRVVLFAFAGIYHLIRKFSSPQLMVHSCECLKKINFDTTRFSCSKTGAVLFWLSEKEPCCGWHLSLGEPEARLLTRVKTFSGLPQWDRESKRFPHNTSTHNDTISVSGNFALENKRESGCSISGCARPCVLSSATESFQLHLSPFCSHKPSLYLWRLRHLVPHNFSNLRWEKYVGLSHFTWFCFAQELWTLVGWKTCFIHGHVRKQLSEISSRNWRVEHLLSSLPPTSFQQTVLAVIRVFIQFGWLFWETLLHRKWDLSQRWHPRCIVCHESPVRCASPGSLSVSLSRTDTHTVQRHRRDSPKIPNGNQRPTERVRSLLKVTSYWIWEFYDSAADHPKTTPLAFQTSNPTH